MKATALREQVDVIMNELETRFPAHFANEGTSAHARPLMIAIDGRCGSGKTLLAGLLKDAIEREYPVQPVLIHMDDFYLRREQRTAERYLEPGGNFDRERFTEEVLTPLCSGKPFDYRPLKCPSLTFGTPVHVEIAEIAIIEGSYSLHGSISGSYDLKVFITVDPDEQRRRLLEREGEKGFEGFIKRWIPLEELYLGESKPWKNADIVFCSKAAEKEKDVLKKPVVINKLQLANRLAMPPMATAKADENGFVGDELLSYYDEKSKGGFIGLIIAEHSFVSRDGKASARQLSCADDEAIDGLRRLTRTIHANGCPVFAQINHAGASAKSAVTGEGVISASALKSRREGAEMPRAMDEADIRRVTAAFADAAKRVKEAGFDGVEIHSAHGYLLNQFFSPLTNKRTDAYGGSLENRIRLHLEIIKAVRGAVGADYPVAIRLGACDYAEGGSSIRDAVAACKAFEAAGIDLLDISGGLCSYINPFSDEEGYFSEITEAIRREVCVPVLLTGGIVTRDAAENLLESGKADIIGVGRAILADSDWARRAMEAAE